MKNHLLHWVVTIILLLINYPSNSQGTEYSFDFEGITREYTLFLPQDYINERGAEYPLVIYLHSRSSTANLDLEYTGFAPIADSADFILVAPEAIDRAWNSGLGDNPEYPTSDANDVGFINELIDVVRAEVSNIDPERIYACGFSNGGYMTYRLACNIGHRLAAIATVAGAMSLEDLYTCNLTAPTPVLQVHGTEDSYVDPDGNQYYSSVNNTLDLFRNLNNCSQTDSEMMPDLDDQDECTVEKISYSDNSNNSSVIYFKVIDGGHEWPGATWQDRPTENRNMDINAGTEIINFFNNHSRESSVGVEDYVISDNYNLLQNYPNPFSNSTVIKYTLPVNNHVELSIINITGRIITTLLSEKQSAGTYTIEWDTSDLDCGVYFCKLTSGNINQVHKIISLK